MLHVEPASKGRIGYIALVSTLILLLLLDYWCHFSWLTPPLMLGAGLLCALVFGSPYPRLNATLSKQLLQWSIVGLGFGMNLEQALASGATGMSLTIVSVFGTLALGVFLGTKLLGVDRKISYLISSGTAICGGSAIAAVGPTIDADQRDMSVALGTVFILNAVALFCFPVIGHWLGLSQHDFGLWAAIAIHDTSSVVGAGVAYGEEALQMATMIKLTRALWIIPLALVSAAIWRQGKGRIRIPWFILYFVLALIVNTYFVQSNFPEVAGLINSIARKGMMFAMFAIGASLSWQTLRSIGIKPFLLGLVLWLIVSSLSLGIIIMN